MNIKKNKHARKPVEAVNHFKVPNDEPNNRQGHRPACNSQSWFAYTHHPENVTCRACRRTVAFRERDSKRSSKAIQHVRDEIVKQRVLFGGYEDEIPF